MAVVVETAVEITFDGILGPTYNHSASQPGGPGNLASQANRGKPSNPRAAALEGLTKAEQVMRLGVRVGVLPALVRPNLERLYQLGVIKDEGLLGGEDCCVLARHLAEHAFAAPHLVAAAFSGSSVWTANWATVSPSSDTDDGFVHLTPANQSRSFHRSAEAQEVCELLKQVFADGNHFKVHNPLPGTYALGDEGAANHLRFAFQHGDKGVNVFIYGRDGFRELEPGRRNLARQTLEASRAVARLHGLDPFFTLFIEQNPKAIDKGIFHNDVISSANLGFLLYHQLAFSDPVRVVSELKEAYRARTQGQHRLETMEVSEDKISLDEARVSYLFNSQIVATQDHRTVLIAPRQCEFLPNVRSFLEGLKRDEGCPIKEVVYVDIPASMQNGGGPACLRLRAVLTDEQKKAISGRVFLDGDLLRELRDLINKEYPTTVSDRDFVDAQFLRQSFDTSKRLYGILGLTPYGIA